MTPPGASSAFPYQCELEFAFPTPESAERTKRVLEVDEEVGDRVRKTLEIDASSLNVLRVTFQASEAKMLRVSVSGFCDYMIVALRCQQEFDAGDISLQNNFA